MNFTCRALLLGLLAYLTLLNLGSVNAIRRTDDVPLDSTLVV